MSHFTQDPAKLQLLADYYAASQVDSVAEEDTDDYLKLMANEKKMNQWEKLANAEMHRLQLKSLIQDTKPVDVKPIEVKFISSKTNDNLNRLEQIESSVKESLNIKQDA